MEQLPERQEGAGRGWQLPLFHRQPPRHSWRGILTHCPSPERAANFTWRTCLSLVDLAPAPWLAATIGATDHNHLLLQVTCPALPTGRAFRKKAKEEVTAPNRDFERWGGCTRGIYQALLPSPKVKSIGGIYCRIRHHTIKSQPWAKLIPRTKHKRIQETTPGVTRHSRYCRR